MRPNFSNRETLNTLEFLGFYLENCSAWVHDHGDSKTVIEHDNDPSAPEFLTDGPVIVWTEATTDFDDGIERDYITFPTLAHALLEFYGHIEGAPLPPEMSAVSRIAAI